MYWITATLVGNAVTTTVAYAVAMSLPESRS